jgi:hypothetical protein
MQRNKISSRKVVQEQHQRASNESKKETVQEGNGISINSFFNSQEQKEKK